MHNATKGMHMWKRFIEKKRESINLNSWEHNNNMSSNAVSDERLALWSVSLLDIISATDHAIPHTPNNRDSKQSALHRGSSRTQCLPLFQSIPEIVFQQEKVVYIGCPKKTVGFQKIITGKCLTLDKEILAEN